jgi:hypothetical protein
MKKIIYYLIAGIAILSSCSGESALQPTDDILIDQYLSQKGASDAVNQRIKELYEKYGTYFVYDFTDKDIKWSLVSTSTSSSMTYTKCDVNYVDKLLDWIEESTLSKYPESFLKKNLPYKLYLAKTVMFYASWMDAYYEWPENSIGTSIVFGYGSEEITTMTSADKYDYYNRIHRDLLAFWISNNKISIPNEFYTVSNYNKNISSSYKYYSNPEQCNYDDVAIPSEDMLNEGFLGANYASWGLSLSTLKSNDVSAFLNFMRYFKSDSEQWKLFLSHPKIKQKYDILVNYFIQNNGYDPRSIGNVEF